MVILCIGAHPDDVEVYMGAAAARMHAAGHKLHILTSTDGSKGHFKPEYISDPESLVTRRWHEASTAAEAVGATYSSLRVPDGEVYVTQALTEEMVRAIRSCGESGHGPDVVITNRPTDYHRDHRYTAQLVLDASYMLTVPALCPDTPHLDRMPIFAYWHDNFTEGGSFRADVVVPCEPFFQDKVNMAAYHESQFFEWLPYNQGILDTVPTSREDRVKMLSGWIEKRDAVAAAKYADRLPEGTATAEAFQISEYGRQPKAEELREIFCLTEL